MPYPEQHYGRRLRRQRDGERRKDGERNTLFDTHSQPHQFWHKIDKGRGGFKRAPCGGELQHPQNLGERFGQPRLHQLPVMHDAVARGEEAPLGREYNRVRHAQMVAQIRLSVVNSEHSEPAQMETALGLC